MNINRIQYTAKTEYVETNKKNIKAVTHAVNALNDDNIFYIVYLLGDGKTFMHIAGAKEGNPGDTIGNLEEFKTFRAGLEGNTETPPDQTPITLVGASFKYW